MQQHDDRVVAILILILAHMFKSYFMRLSLDVIALLIAVNFTLKSIKQSSNKK